jgi:hypothetical protein
LKKNRLSLALLSLFLIVLLCSAFSINIVGTNDLNFTFEKDILYNETNPISDFGYNIRNQTDFGHYNATYSFDGEVGLEKLDISFVDNVVGVDDLIVISSYLGHDDVLLAGDSGVDYFSHYFDEQIEGSIEFWIDLYNGTAIQFYLFDDTSNGMLSRIYADTTRNYKGDGIGGTEYENHAISEGMTHFKVVWDCTSDTFDLFINNYHFFDGVNFMGDFDLTHIDNFRLQIHTPDSYGVLDAYGESWDETHYTNEWFDLSGEGTEPLGITWDGSNYWVCFTEVGSGEVYQYTSAGIYTGTNFDTTTEDKYPMGLTWYDNHLWIVGSFTDEVYKYTSAGVYTGVHFDVGAQDGMPVGITWDGEYFWVMGDINDEVYQYNSTGSYTGFHFDVSSAGIHPSDITWDGEYLWILGYTDQEVYQYTIAGVYTGVHFDVIDTDIAQEGIIYIDGFFWLTGLGNIKAYEYEYIKFPYNIGDNLIPYRNYTNIKEIDKWEFFNNENGSATVNGQQDIPSWDELLTIGYITKNLEQFEDETAVYFPIGDADHEGLERSINVSNGHVREVDFNVGWGTRLGSVKLHYFFDIDSYDATLICRLKIDDSVSHGDLRLYYYNGSDYIELEDVNNIYTTFFINIMIIDNLVVLNLNYTTTLPTESSGGSTYNFSTIVNDKDGIGDVKVEVYADSYYPANGGLLIDSIGVYVDGISQSNDFGNLYYAMNDDYNNIYDNFFTINATGFFGCSMISFEMSPQTYVFFSYQNASEFSFKNTCGDNEKIVENAHLSITFNNSFNIYSVFIHGIILTDNTNDYKLEFESSGIDIQENYFYVSNNRLYWNLDIDDDNLEYIQATFNIQNVASENRSLYFTSNIDGNPKGYLSVEYESGSNSLMEFPYYLTTTNVILPQTESIDKFTILITDNDKDNNDFSEGYITNIRLIYYPDLAITITTLNLLGILVPLIIMIAPPLALNKKFGSSVIVPMFLLMSLVCVLTNLIPVWLFFIIAFSSIGFLIMKKKVEVAF